MRIKERLEDILVWILVALIILFGLWILDTIISSNLFWEIIELLVENAKYIFGAGLLFIFIQQGISAYKKDGIKGIKSLLIKFLVPIGVFLLMTLGLRLYVINPFFVVVPLMICFIYGIIKWIIQVNRD